jgi:hypothetical protein
MQRPWRFDPSAYGSRVAISCIAAVALIIAAYMGLYQWRLIDSVWDPIFGEQTLDVLDSDVSHQVAAIIVIPDAILGALAYIGDIVLALAGSGRRWRDRPWLVMLFGLDVIVISLVSAVLIALQGTVVGAWCFLCLVTAALSLILVGMAAREVWASLLFLRQTWKAAPDFATVWHTFWGIPITSKPWSCGMRWQSATIG